MGKLKIVCVLLILVCTVGAGCSSKPDKNEINMGPMPTAPPSGSPYAAAKSSMSPDAFVTQLQGMSRDQRPAFIQQNQALMSQIMGGPDSPAKQKLTAIINQH